MGPVRRRLAIGLASALALLVGVPGWMGTAPAGAGAAPPEPAPRVLEEGMWGQDVLQLQLALEELGLSAADSPGYFGPATRRALMRFQQALGLQPDGVLGPATRRVLDSLARRYSYQVQPGDTLWEIARRFATTMEALMEENGLTETSLRPGQTLVIPTLRRLYVPVSVRLSELARRLGVAARTLAELNELQPEDTVSAGSELWTPLPRMAGGGLGGG